MARTPPYSGPVSSWGPPVYCKRTGGQCGTGISVAASATGPAGPWNITYGIVKFSATNPGAPIFAKDGSLIMAYKTWAKAGRCIGIVSAPRWDAFPYDGFPVAPHTAASCIGAAQQLEDPSNLWRNRRGVVHMLFHERAWGGGAASFDGGATWDYNGTRVAYPYTVEVEDGSTIDCIKREEPKVLVEDGVPTLLITQCMLGAELPPTAPSKQFPAGEAQHLTRVIMQPINTRPK